jgi:hypothetical protein
MVVMTRELRNINRTAADSVRPDHWKGELGKKCAKSAVTRNDLPLAAHERIRHPSDKHVNWAPR